MIAVAMTLGLLFIYCAGNIGVFFYFRRERRAEFNFFLHFLLPLLSTISLLWVTYKSVVPLPEPPVRYAPMLAAVWLFAGIVVMFGFRALSERVIMSSGCSVGISCRRRSDSPQKRRLKNRDSHANPFCASNEAAASKTRSGVEKRSSSRSKR